MPTYRIVGEPPESVEIRNGLMLYAGVAGREEATVASTSRTSALLEAGRIVVVDPDAEPPEPDPIYDPIYVDRDSGEMYRNEGGGVLEPFGDGATDVEVAAGIASHNASGAAHADITARMDAMEAGSAFDDATDLQEPHWSAGSSAMVWRDPVAWDVNYFPGVIFDGSGTDTTAAIQSAIDDLAELATAENHVTLKFSGNYSVDAIFVRSYMTFDLGDAHFHKHSNGPGGTVSTMFRHAEPTSPAALTRLSDVTIKGGHLHGDDKTGCASLVRMLFVDRLKLADITVESTLHSTWAFDLGGDYGTMTRCKVFNQNRRATEDAFHFRDVRYWSVSDCYGEGGDDVYALGREPSSDATFYMQPMHDITFRDCKGYTERGRIFSCYVRGESVASARISKVRGNFLGAAGVERNEAVLISDFNAGAAGTSLISDVWIDVDLDVGGEAHEGAFAQAIEVDCADDVRVTGRVNITDGPVLTLTDVVTTSGSVTLTGPPGKFTEAMQDVRISGAGIPEGNVIAAPIAADGSSAAMAKWRNTAGTISATASATISLTVNPGFVLAKVRNSRDVVIDVTCDALGGMGGVDARLCTRPLVIGHMTHGAATATDTVRFIDCPGARATGKYLGVKSGFQGVYVPSGTTTTLDVIRATISHEVGAAAGFAVSWASSTVATHIRLLDNDFSGSRAGYSGASRPTKTTTNNTGFKARGNTGPRCPDAKYRRTVTGNTTVNPDDEIIELTGTSGATFTLQAASTMGGGFEVIAIDTGGNAGTNPIVWDGNAAELVNGGATFNGVTSNFGTSVARCNGTGWFAR